MVSLHALRTHPKFAPLFADVYVVCWPILWWQLNRLLAFCRREDIADVLYTLSPWGFITVNFHSDRPAPAACKPPARTFRPLTAPAGEAIFPLTLRRLRSSRQRTPPFSSPAKRAEVALRAAQ